MDCPLIAPNLIGYHFATLTDDERRDVEGHLVACTGCLRSYLALKAHVDGVGEREAPSEGARLRLRAAVELRFRPTAARRLGRWLARPVPLYQGLAVAAVIALFAAMEPSIVRVVRPSTAPRIAERVDTARSAPESDSLY